MGMSISRSASVAPSFVNLDTEETKEWKGIARKNITNTRVIDALEPLKRRASIGHANGDPGNMGVEVVTTMCGQMDVNNDLFWQEWADCGGQVDRYVTESMQNYSITAGLLISMTFPYTVETPDHVIEYSPNIAKAFSACMTLAYMLNIFLIVVTLTLYQQLCCTFDTTTATNFAGHFGYLVTIQAIMMVVMILLITAAMFFALFTQDFGDDDNTSLYIAVGIPSTPIMMLLIYYAYQIPSWNQKHNYWSAKDLDCPGKFKPMLPLGERRCHRLKQLIKLATGGQVGRGRNYEVRRMLADQGVDDETRLYNLIQLFVKMKQLEAGSEGAKPVTSGQRRAEQASAAAAATAAAAAESLDPDVLKVYDSNIEMTPTYYEADHVDADDIVEAPTHLIAEALRQIGFHPFEAMELALYMNDVQWIRKQHQIKSRCSSIVRTVETLAARPMERRETHDICRSLVDLGCDKYYRDIPDTADAAQGVEIKPAEFPTFFRALHSQLTQKGGVSKVCPEPPAIAAELEEHFYFLHDEALQFAWWLWTADKRRRDAGWFRAAHRLTKPRHVGRAVQVASALRQSAANAQVEDVPS